ncbi:response regulator [Candidatus Margulisiibacteriota bacterium]
MHRLSSIIIEKAHFSNETIRQEFRAYHRKLFSERLNILLYIAVIAIPLFGWLDIAVNPQHINRFLIYRAATTILALLFLLINNSRWGRKVAHIIAAACFTIMALRITAMIIILGGEISNYYVAIIITMLWGLSILPYSLIEAVFTCTIVYLIYLGGIILFDPQITDFFALVSNNFFLLTSFAILCSASYFNHKSRFKEFQLRRELRESRGDLKQYADNLEKMVEKKTNEKIQLEQQLFQMQKMEAIGTMAGGIAHDFNNLLWTVLGYASFIRTIRADDRELNEHLKVIEHSAKQASGLTQQLLTLSRKDTHAFKPVNLGEVVETAASLLEKSIKPNLEFICHIAKGLKTVEADPSQIEQAIINLGINANHAMEGDGQLIIRANNISLEKNITEIPPGEYVRISIADTGQGIPEEIRLKIFEPFFTTKPEGKGTGMGLAMVYRMVKNHNGFIHFDSALNQGTTFNLYFPASAKKAISLKSKKETKTISRGKETILIVDNENTLRQMLGKILKSLGYHILQAEGGEQAIKLYTKQPQDIDLVILDMHMPGLNGKETYYELKKINSKVKVLISSGYIEAEDVQEIMTAGAAGTLAKPYGVIDISTKVHQVLHNK